METGGGFDAADAQFAQGSLHGRYGFFAGFAMDDDFCDHRIVVWWDGVSGMGMRIDSHAKAAGQIHGMDFSGTRLEIAIGVFGIDPAFDRCASGFDVALFESEYLA